MTFSSRRTLAKVGSNLNLSSPTRSATTSSPKLTLAPQPAQPPPPFSPHSASGHLAHSSCLLYLLFFPHCPSPCHLWLSLFPLFSLQAVTPSPQCSMRPWYIFPSRAWLTTGYMSSLAGSSGFCTKNRVLCFRASPMKQGYYAQNYARLEV